APSSGAGGRPLDGHALPGGRACRRQRRAPPPRGDVPPGAGDPLHAPPRSGRARGRAGRDRPGRRRARDAGEPPRAVDDRLAPGRELLAARALVLERPTARQDSGLGGTVAAHDIDEGELRRELAGSRTPQEALQGRRRLARSLAKKGELDEALALLGQIEAVHRARSREDEVAGTLG